MVGKNRTRVFAVSFLTAFNSERRAVHWHFGGVSVTRWLESSPFVDDQPFAVSAMEAAAAIHARRSSLRRWPFAVHPGDFADAIGRPFARRRHGQKSQFWSFSTPLPNGDLNYGASCRTASRRWATGSVDSAVRITAPRLVFAQDFVPVQGNADLLVHSGAVASSFPNVLSRGFIRIDPKM